MCIVLRGRRFHYRFKIDGKDYSGSCCIPPVPKDASPAEIEALRKEAVAFEAAEREKVVQEKYRIEQTEREVRMNKSVVALIENYKFELTGGTRIPFKDAFPLAAAKPSRRKSTSSYAGLRETYWNDFALFMEETFPDIADLSSVRRTHCEAYVAHLADHGRYNKKVEYQYTGARKRPKAVSYEQDYKISAKTIKEIVGVCKWVFSRLEEDAGIVRDPWKDIVLPAGESIDREIFTHDELLAIWRGMQTDSFCGHLFFIAANSGMTEGDICTLEWSDIDWTASCVRRKRRKTGASIVLPLLPELREYLATLPRSERYVSPSHAEMYLRQPSSVSARVKNFLHNLGIETTVKVEGRRAQSMKDLHSLRHVFCYRAKRAGIPESSIMQMVGHRVLAMTQHYANHDTVEDLAADIKKLPVLFAGELESTDVYRKRLAELAYRLPLDQVKALLAVVPAEEVPSGRLLA